MKPTEGATAGIKVLILMAGIGSRLGSAVPKCLTPLRPDVAGFRRGDALGERL